MAIVMVMMSGPSVSEIICGNAPCSNGDECCIDKCFNTSLYHCVAYTLCPLSLYPCGGSCYHPSLYNCYLGSIITINQTNTSLEIRTRVESSLCPIHRPPCGGSCYDPFYYECENKMLRQRPQPPRPVTCGDSLCPSSLQGCCNGTTPNITSQYNNSQPQCWDKLNEVCCTTQNNDGNTITRTCGMAPSGQAEGCCAFDGQIICYDPAVYLCCLGYGLCQIGVRCCVHGLSQIGPFFWKSIVTFLNILSDCFHCLLTL